MRQAVAQRPGSDTHRAQTFGWVKPGRNGLTPDPFDRHVTAISSADQVADLQVFNRTFPHSRRDLRPCGETVKEAAGDLLP